MANRLFTLVAATAFALALGGSKLQAQIVDSHGFETPFFTTTFSGTGILEGQNSWIADNATASTAIVQSTIVKSGTQAVRVDKASNSNRRWADPVAGFPSIPDAIISISWDMRVEQTVSAAFGPFFGVESYDDAFVIGALGVDASTGDVLFYDAGTGFATETGSFATFGAWHSYRMELDYSTNDYRIYMDNVLIDSIGFVDDALVIGGIDGFSDADITAVTLGTDTLTGTAYFDNFVVTQVPEPGGILLGALSMVMLGARRRAAR